MEDFAASEKYRKYLIEIKIAGQTYYTVWGSDMADDEANKMLVKDGKLLLISNLDDVRQNALARAPVFNDADNFKRWLDAEKLEQFYSDYNLDILLWYDKIDMTDRDKSIDLLNTINLLQDFFEQVDEQDMPLFYQEVADLKDFIYDNYFWMDDEPEEDFYFTPQVKLDLEQSYQLVIEKYLHVV